MFFTANCRACGHKMSLHHREGAQGVASRAMNAIFNPPDEAYESFAPTTQGPVVPSGPSAGWYSDPDGTPNLRWWNGQDWTDHRK